MNGVYNGGGAQHTGATMVKAASSFERTHQTAARLSETAQRIERIAGMLVGFDPGKDVVDRDVVDRSPEAPPPPDLTSGLHVANSRMAGSIDRIYAAANAIEDRL